MELSRKAFIVALERSKQAAPQQIRAVRRRADPIDGRLER